MNDHAFEWSKVAPWKLVLLGAVGGLAVGAVGGLVAGRAIERQPRRAPASRALAAPQVVPRSELEHFLA